MVQQKDRKEDTEMAKIFITGSSDGLGQLAARRLVEDGHQVVLHARNPHRARQALSQVPGATNVLVADLSDAEETLNLATKVNALGSFDAVIHNAGVYHVSGREIFSVNTLAPYLLTCLIQKPERLVYLSSGLHKSGIPDLGNMDAGSVTYSDSKLHDLILAKAVARRWPDTYSNAVEPGWVPTKMGGAGAPDDLQKGYETQVWLAASDDARISGRYFFHRKEAPYLKVSDDPGLQDEFLEKCAQITGVPFPGKDSG
jgi:NAD(P)-dependent dehydrogenase (short-subunit alcohol dehydrogenase family)